MSEHDATIRDLQKSLENMTWQRDRIAFELKNLQEGVKWQKVHMAGLYLEIEDLQKKLGIREDDE